MHRNEKLLKYVSKDGCGVEVGPSVNPIAPKKNGYNVQIIDHMNREQLTEKYRDHHVNLENIEDVDFVWQGESYSELTGKRNYYDWIIASHVIEHAPDLIAFLNDCASILKDDGVLSLAIPDKRYCFDHYRPISGLSQIIDRHFEKKLTHTPGSVAEYFLNIVTKEGCIAWDVNTTGEYCLNHSIEDAIQAMSLVLKEGSNLDIHAWCFTPHSFRLIIYDLFCLGLIPFKEVEFFPSEGCEFHVALSRRGSGLQEARLDILKRIESEVGTPEPIKSEVQLEVEVDLQEDQVVAPKNKIKLRAERLFSTLINNFR
jgi:predicted SAM-dependent methyltransferase